ncbi:hypothetical protein LEP1GSC013_4299 [Leptospira interrogans serovar Valbuzzi str. Duyster]|nr:hypothetical protein LEP1GSC013_4299 [Leptospira interrogans serovar Valbuzzi str. Duyster]
MKIWVNPAATSRVLCSDQQIEVCLKTNLFLNPICYRSETF